MAAPSGRSPTTHSRRAHFSLIGARRFVPPDLGRWVALQEWVAANDCRVSIPFARDLAELVPPIAVRLRRDFSALLNLIRAHALLHQATRERDQDGRIVATVEEYGVVRGLVGDLVSDGVEATVPRRPFRCPST